MQQKTNDNSTSRTRTWLTEYPRALPLAVFLLIASITILSVVVIERAERERERDRLDDLAMEVGSTLERRSYAISAYLRSGAALFSTLDEVSPSTFRRFVNELELGTDYRGSDGIGWAEFVQGSEVEAFEDRIADATGSAITVFPEPEFASQRVVPVTYLNPLTPRNARAIGYDMYSEPTRAAAMEAAIRSGRPTASGPVRLLQDGDGAEPGFLIYMPVFESGSRNMRLRGFVYTPYNGAAFLQSALEVASTDDAALRLYDGRVSPDSLVAQIEGDFPSGIAVNQEINVGNRPMILQAEITNTYSLSTLSMLTALFGLMVGGLLTLVARLLTQQATEDQARLSFYEQQNSIRNSLTRELNHRVKNTLANVLSIIHLTRRRSDDLESFADGLDGRIRALSATHDLLTQSDWGTTPIGDVVAAELAPYTGEQDRAVETGGPEVELAPNDALSLGLALHELATNAAKYGALSLPAGKVDINWEKVTPNLARLRWTERGGPRVPEDRVRGFGTDLIEKIVAHELRHPVDLRFEASGVTCNLLVPVREREDFVMREKARQRELESKTD